MAITSSLPRSSSRTRWTSSACDVSAMIGVSGEAAHSPCSLLRTWSTSASVLPLTSTRIRSGAAARRYAKAVLLVVAVSTW